MKLSKYFTLDEMTRSRTAELRNILNVPNDEQIENLTDLCIYVLDPIRDAVGRPVEVTSGYRSNLLNKAVGGSRTSQHPEGKSADILKRTCELYKYDKQKLQSILPTLYIYRGYCSVKNEVATMRQIDDLIKNYFK